MYNRINKYLAELIGTFGLVFCGTGAIIVNQEYSSALGHAGVAIAWGLAVTVMIYCFGSISGAHLNPAVTLSLWMGKLFPFKDVIPYISGQLLGAITASALLKFLFPFNETLGSTLPSGSVWQSFIFEFLMTFFLMLTIFKVAIENENTKPLAGIIIGLVILLEAMFGGPVSGASMNPARSIGPAIISGHMQHLWIYITAPIPGALAATLFNNIMKK